MRRSNLGQITTVTSVVSKGITQGAALASQKAILTQEKRLERMRQETTKALTDKEIAYKREELQRQAEIAARRDAVFQKLFLMSVIGLAGLGIIMVGGVTFLKKGKQ